MCNRSMYKIFMFNRLCIMYIACQKHFYTNNFNWSYLRFCIILYWSNLCMYLLFCTDTHSRYKFILFPKYKISLKVSKK
jgi:hypothetical protein